MWGFKFNFISRARILETPQWKDMIDAMDHSTDENLIVIWPPWCWKSTVAAHRLDYLKDKNIVYLTYNNLLAEYIKQSFEDWDIVKDKIKTFFSFFHFNLDEIKFLEQNYISKKTECLDLIENKFKGLQKELDVLIIDEWQDVPLDMYKHTTKLAKHNSIFLDVAQSIYDHWIKTTEQFNQLKNYLNWVEYQLTINRRNPRWLFEFALQLNPTWVSTSNLKLMKVVSWSVEVYQCVNEVIEFNEILEIFKQAKNKNIGVLFHKRSEIDDFCRRLNENWYQNEYTKFHSSNNQNLSGFKNILITSFHSSKWLEFDIVIIPTINIGYWNRFIDDNLLFVAFTRAKEQLIITYVKWKSFIESKIRNFDKTSYDFYQRDSKNKISKEFSLEDIPF